MKILQFGEGNFLRAFADWMIDVANEKGVIDAQVIVVPPRFHQSRTIDALKKQGGDYSVVLEGIADGKACQQIRKVTCIADVICPETEMEKYDECVCDADLRVVISNTTEAGIAYQKDDVRASIPATFPGKVTSLLYKRFRHFNGAKDKGLIFVCCELIENNGQMLRQLVLRHADENNLGEAFKVWVEENSIFCDSLVDRIVSGFPTDTINELRPMVGYDALVVKGEMYHLWVISAPRWEKVAEVLPLHKAGLNVCFASTCSEFRNKKVRILNGCHTAMTQVALMMRLETVRDAITDAQVSEYVNKMLDHEILPMLSGEKDELRTFADKIVERFLNPYIHHNLSSIALNSLSKWEARLWPTVKDVYDCDGRYAHCAIFSFAALLMLYAGATDFVPQDTDINRLEDYVKQYDAQVPGFARLVEEYKNNIATNGIREALTYIL